MAVVDDLQAQPIAVERQRHRRAPRLDRRAIAVADDIGDKLLGRDQDPDDVVALDAAVTAEAIDQIADMAHRFAVGTDLQAGLGALAHRAANVTEFPHLVLNARPAVLSQPYGRVSC